MSKSVWFENNQNVVKSYSFSPPITFKMVKNVKKMSKSKLQKMLSTFSKLVQVCKSVKNWQIFVYFSDNELLFRDATGGLSILTLDDFVFTQILSNTTFVSHLFKSRSLMENTFLYSQRRYNVAQFSLSPTRRFVLLTHGVKKVSPKGKLPFPCVSMELLVL